MADNKKEFVGLIQKEVKREPVDLLLNPTKVNQPSETPSPVQIKPVSVSRGKSRPVGRPRLIDEPGRRKTFFISDWSIEVMEAIIHKKINTTNNIHFNQRNAIELAISTLATQEGITIEGVFPRPEKQ